MDADLLASMAGTVTRPQIAPLPEKNEANPCRMTSGTFVDQTQSLGRRASAPSKFRRYSTRCLISTIILQNAEVLCNCRLRSGRACVVSRLI
jgi:hypothetical protein